MAIHYSLELGAGCRSMGRTHQKPNTGYFLRSPGLQPPDWPTVSVSPGIIRPVMRAVESRALVTGGSMIASCFFFLSFFGNSVSVLFFT